MGSTRVPLVRFFQFMALLLAVNLALRWSGLISVPWVLLLWPVYAAALVGVLLVSRRR